MGNDRVGSAATLHRALLFARCRAREAGSANGRL